MKLTVLGSSGSVPGPDNAASGYYLSVPGMPGVLLDIGGGVLGAMQKYGINPSDSHVLLSHLHADHCSDFPSLMVWRRYHPQSHASQAHMCIGPSDTPVRMGLASADEFAKPDDMSDTLQFRPWTTEGYMELGPLRLRAFPAIHPIEAYSMRIEMPKDRVLAYSGDSAFNENLIECARGADIFICEATWGKSSAGQPPAMHLSGPEAGIVAREAGVKHLLITHIPPWCDPADSLNGARSEFDGPITLARPGESYSF
ncbi:MAG: MBL fold metallo-hydrolase [Corynebacterium sp.]|nr:MBL fold metallo-hydrolase [Corynebacterium sp.]